MAGLTADLGSAARSGDSLTADDLGISLREGCPYVVQAREVHSGVSVASCPFSDRDGSSDCPCCRRDRVGEQLLCRWVRLARQRGGARDTDAVLDADERAELERLRRENAELRLDRDFLEKRRGLLRLRAEPVDAYQPRNLTNPSALGAPQRGVLTFIRGQMSSRNTFCQVWIRPASVTEAAEANR